MKSFFSDFLYSGYIFKSNEIFVQYRFKLLNMILGINVIISVFFILLSLFNINGLAPFLSVYILFLFIMLLLIFFLRTSQERYNTVLYLLIGSALAMFTFVLIVITHDEFRLVWFLLLSFSAFMFGGKRVGQVSTLLSFVIIVATYNFFELGISATALVAALISLIIGAIIINSYTSTMDRFAIALDDAKEEAEAMAHVKAEFLAAMSHEIRTPMNGVIGMLGLLINSKLSDTQQHQAYVAQSSANSLLTLINDILDFSKVDAGHLELENLDFNLRNQLGDFADGIALKAEEKGVELILDLTQIQHAMVRSDPGRLRQILTNIVGNAIKFTHEGEILIKAALDIQSNQTARVRISVSDTGVGIPKDKIETLFDTFTQVDASTTRKYGGTGLGLAIAKKLVYLMKGDISVQSILGKGSTFTFDIEVGLSEDRSIVMPTVPIEGKKVLIVDDNATNREVLKRQLEHWGIEVSQASSAHDGMALCQDRVAGGAIPPFDIAFLDMQMPEVDGAQLGTNLRAVKNYDQMKMVMMTSLESRNEAQFFADIGFDAFFPKPTSTKDIFSALNVLVDDSKALEQAQPLVTKDYLSTLENNDAFPSWPKDTRILLVEDNRTNQLVANGMLEMIGLTADVANNGIEALAAIKQASESFPYTLVLMDCQMPEMDGYEATKWIRVGQGGRESRLIPIIAMTANVMKGDREKCILSGMDDYMAKPINLEMLKTTLIQWLIEKPRLKS